MKLSQAQERALKKLKAKSGEFVSPYEIQESTATLDALTRKGLAVSRTSGLGALFSPRTGRHYMLKPEPTP